MTRGKKSTEYESPVTSPKIKRLERILEKQRNETPLKERIKRKEEFLEFLVSQEMKSNKKIKES